VADADSAVGSHDVGYQLEMHHRLAQRHPFLIALQVPGVITPPARIVGKALAPARGKEVGRTANGRQDAEAVEALNSVSSQQVTMPALWRGLHSHG
jgi:hypothetical protein